MICQRCDGTGLIERDRLYALLVLRKFETCPDCGGYGIIHCCEGEIANDPRGEDQE